MALQHSINIVWHFTHGRRFAYTAALVFILPIFCLLSPVLAFAAQFPSLFRGVVVTDSPIGVKVVSVEEVSQAHEADLRTDDVIVRVDAHEVHSIDEFATLSTSLKGRALKATILVFRNGQPMELQLHLYSYPILRAWSLEFIPDYDMRFAQPSIGLEYWKRLGRGFEDAGNPELALEAYLNALHNVPTDVSTAIKASNIFFELSRKHISENALAEGVTLLRQALLLANRLFDYQLTDDELITIKDQLSAMRDLLHQTVVESPSKASK